MDNNDQLKTPPLDVKTLSNILDGVRIMTTYSRELDNTTRSDILAALTCIQEIQNNPSNPSSLGTIVTRFNEALSTAALNNTQLSDTQIQDIIDQLNEELTVNLSVRAAQLIIYQLKRYIKTNKNNEDGTLELAVETSVEES